MRYRNRPVEVEARKLTAENLMEVAAWCGGVDVADLEWDYDAGTYWRPEHNGHYNVPPRERGIVVPTLEGDHFARLGDYVICGVRGEFYPCEPGIFAETYELAGTADVQP